MADPGDHRRGLPRRAAVVYGVLGLIAAVAIVFGLDSVYGFLGGSTSSSAAQRTATVAYGTVQSSVSASGNVSVATSASADFETSGTLSAVHVAVGDRVHAGQVLARLDPTTALAALESSQASLAQAESALSAAEAGPTAAQQATNTTSLQQAEAEVTQAKQQLVTDEAAVTAAKQQLVIDKALGCPPAGSTSSGSGSSGSTGSASSAASSTGSNATGSTATGSTATGPSATGSAGAGQGSTGTAQTGTRKGLEVTVDSGPTGAGGPNGATGATGATGTTPATTTTGTTGASGSKSAATISAASSSPARSAPSVATGLASSIAATTATYGGTVDPAGENASYWFEYGTSPSSLGSKTAKVGAGSGTAAVAVTANVSGLAPGRTYYFRLMASNATGTATGATVSFATLAAAPPTVATGSASNVLTKTATLNGTVDPNGSPTTYWFEYGTTSAYGQRTASAAAGSATTAGQVAAQVAGLAANTAYLYRLVASNGSGTSYGLGQVLETSSSSCVADAAAIVAAEQAVTAQKQTLAAAEANLNETQATISQSDNPSATTIEGDKAAVTQAQAQVTSDRKAVAETVLRSPVYGTVTAVTGSVGDTVSGGGSSVSRGAANASSSSASGTGAGLGTGTGSSGSGSSTSTAFATIETLHKLEVVSGFAEADATKLAVGQPATITFPALPDVEVAGKVTDVSSTSTVVSNVVTYDATIALIAPPAEVKEGMTANVAVVTETRAHVLELPSSAITTNGTLSTVQLVSNGKTTVTRIQTGVVGDSSTEIVSGVPSGALVAIPTVTVTAASGTGATTAGTGAAIFGGGGGFAGGGGFGRGG